MTNPKNKQWFFLISICLIAEKAQYTMPKIDNKKIKGKKRGIAWGKTGIKKA